MNPTHTGSGAATDSGARSDEAPTGVADGSGGQAPAHGLLYGRRGQWRTDARLRRTFAFATVGWSLVFAIRAGVQAFPYGEDRPGLLAAGKLLPGWPLTILALLLTLAYLRRATAGRTDPGDASPGS